MIRPGVVACCLTALMAGAAQTEDIPAAFRVTGVASDDVLNIRDWPSAESTIIGEIAPFAPIVEVLQITKDGRWGSVGLPDGNGWVSMRFLEPIRYGEPWLVPRPLTCAGTEPFWSISLHPQGATFQTPDSPRMNLTMTSEGVATRGFFAVAEQGPTQVYRLHVSPKFCGDGMTDRVYGWGASLFIESRDGNQMLSGCCTLDARF